MAIKLKKADIENLLTLYACYLQGFNGVGHDPKSPARYSVLRSLGLAESFVEFLDGKVRITPAGIEYLKAHNPEAQLYEELVADIAAQQTAYLTHIDPVMQELPLVSYYYPVYIQNPLKIKAEGGYIRFSFTVGHYHASFTVNFRSLMPYQLSFSKAVLNVDNFQHSELMDFMQQVKDIGDLIVKVHREHFSSPL